MDFLGGWEVGRVPLRGAVGSSPCGFWGAELWVPLLAPQCPAEGGYPEEVRAGFVSALPPPTPRPGPVGTGWVGEAHCRGLTGLSQRTWCGWEGQLRSHRKADTASGNGP